MKKAKILLILALGTTMTFSALSLASCSNPLTDIKFGGKDPQAVEPQVTTLLNFVAVSGTEWDTSVTIDGKAYNLSLDLKSDNSLALAGTCSGKAQSSGGNPSGGPGGSNNPTGNTGGETETEEPEEVDYTKYNFEIGGTWSEEAGWGYTLNLKDSASTTIHVNYDTTSGRQYFYYTVSAVIDGKEVTGSQSKFEAKDSAYRRKLDANYKIYEERVCKYMFRGGQEGGSGNLKSAWLYLMPDGGIACVSGTSNSLSYTTNGSWREDASNHVIAIEVDGTTYTTNGYCDIKGKEGYRVVYSAMTLYASQNPDSFTWDQYHSVDFEGETIYTWTGLGEFSEYTLELTEKMYANVKEGDSVSYKTYYSEDDGVFTIGENSSVTADGETTIHVKWVVVTSNCCGTTETTYESDFRLNK